MVCAPFCWLTHIGSGHLDLAECATSARVGGFHRRDVGRVPSDCQDVFAHGLCSFLLGQRQRASAVDRCEMPVSAGHAGFHGRDVRVVCGDYQDVVSHDCFSFPCRGRVTWSLADSPRSAGVHGFHRRDVRVVRGDCQDVVSHGCFSFPCRARLPGVLRVRPGQQAYTGSMVVMSESSAAIVRMSSAMVCPPFCLARSRRVGQSGLLGPGLWA